MREVGPDKGRVMEYTVSRAMGDDRSKARPNAARWHAARQPLAGGLGVPRALWLLTSRGGLGRVGEWSLLLLVPTLVALFVEAYLGMVLLAVAALAATMRTIRAGQRGRYYQITAKNDPALHGLVQATSRKVLGAELARIWLIAEPTISTSYLPRPLVGGRTELSIGAPLAIELSERELQALVVRELNKLTVPHPWLTGRLLTHRAQLDRPLPPLAAAWADRYVRSTAPLVATVELGADKAAAQVVWPAEVAVALIHAYAVADTFEWFVHTYVMPLATAGQYPRDLYAGWRWKMDVDGLRERRIVGVSAEHFVNHPASELPPLADRISTIMSKVRPLPRAPAADNKPLPASLTEPIQALLARELTSELSQRPVREVTFAKAGAEILDGPTLAVAQLIRELCAGDTLGTGPATLRALRETTENLGDVLNVVRHAAAEHRDIQVFVDAYLSEIPGAMSDKDIAGVLMRALLTLVLHEHGFVAEHPLRRHVVTRADGQRIDIPALISRDPRAEMEIPSLLATLYKHPVR